MHDAESNELRCTAHQIIFDLHKAGELSQIQLLHMAASLAYKSLAPVKFQTAVKAWTLTPAEAKARSTCSKCGGTGEINEYNGWDTGSNTAEYWPAPCPICTPSPN